eukprot:IDg14626t1
MRKFITRRDMHVRWPGITTPTVKIGSWMFEHRFWQRSYDSDAVNVLDTRFFREAKLCYERRQKESNESAEAEKRGHEEAIASGTDPLGSGTSLVRSSKGGPLVTTGLLPDKKITFPLLESLRTWRDEVWPRSGGGVPFLDAPLSDSDDSSDFDPPLTASESAEARKDHILNQVDVPHSPAARLYREVECMDGNSVDVDGDPLRFRYLSYFNDENQCLSTERKNTKNIGRVQPTLRKGEVITSTPVSNVKVLLDSRRKLFEGETASEGHYTLALTSWIQHQRNRRGKGASSQSSTAELPISASSAAEARDSSFGSTLKASAFNEGDQENPVRRGSKRQV